MTTVTLKLNTDKLFYISSDLRELNEVLSKLTSSPRFTLRGYDVTDNLHPSEKVLLDTILVNLVRRQAAPILQRLSENGAPVDVDFLWEDYLVKEEDEADGL